jgi:hypothetical protein
MSIVRHLKTLLLDFLQVPLLSTTAYSWLGRRQAREKKKGTEHTCILSRTARRLCMLCTPQPPLSALITFFVGHVCGLRSKEKEEACAGGRNTLEPLSPKLAY